MSDTVFALATAPGRAAVAILRLSGPATGHVLAALAGSPPPPPRRAVLRQLTWRGELIDRALVLWFPGPGSYTGEDAAELHLHGGAAVVAAATEALLALGLKPAEPGEFTRRAFQNGKLDLTQAEAVADLVDAETAAQRKQALDQLDGALARRYDAWRAGLLDALALVEAEIDFPDEGLPGELAGRARPTIERLVAEIDAALSEGGRGERVREGWRVAVVGAPNAGKSSLFNALVGRDAAIVTPIAGTTRDVIEAPLTLAGYRVLLADTAGVRESGDVVEAEGVRRARAWADHAALRLWVVDASAGDDGWRDAADLLRAGDLCLLNKVDLPTGPAAAAAERLAQERGVEILRLSATSEQDATVLQDVLKTRVVAALSGAEFPAVTRARHRARLSESRAHLVRACSALAVAAELAGEDLRLAARALAQVSGRIDPEDVLDVVFASFCIGK
ncbi:MAG TPA: tRNA uridine-5-carboxymethylaminomethyl(34) synthesis GTPase MnmE [Caulobacteraceae bacterium]|nr:tRNA uridine-5-carboxymethylaminomethyl(34) synthesis GTPase MnmE [Caulobacteraceae bacterium]